MCQMLFLSQKDKNKSCQSLVLYSRNLGCIFHYNFKFASLVSSSLELIIEMLATIEYQLSDLRCRLYCSRIIPFLLS